MRLFLRGILFFAVLFYVVRAQDSVVKVLENEIREEIKLATKETDFLVEKEKVKAKSCIQKGSDYLDYVKGLVADARKELKQNNNRRPSTQYSFYDIAFSVTRSLPAWVYPHTSWKEDAMTRRRRIAKVLRTSSLITRPRLTVIRDTAALWTKTSSHLLQHNYTAATEEAFSSLLQSAEDFVTAATDAELMDSLFLTTGYATLEDAVTHFLANNLEEFNHVLKSINHDFNEIVSLSGDLRRPLESVREDAVQQSKMVRDNLFANHIDKRLRHLSWHIRTELQHLSHELRELPEDDRDTSSKLLRKHIADSLRTEIESLNDIKMTLAKSKSIYHHVWQNAYNELVQNPTSYNYWVDVAAEVKEAVYILGKSLTQKQQQYKAKPTKCTCGYNKQH
ncbi:hypothetical protein V8B55DRAFT_1599031 [Mucor lusitanicus]|uniref:Uncharacterized protein n=2 Tax=Mucor circinelloides f. lusitanicus TaxID=29924 RepID=A0A8H4BFP6_MUCCL|nr:hypothetical protein FB192DRAFT_1459636 [Mucor lusitanicus]